MTGRKTTMKTYASTSTPISWTLSLKRGFGLCVHRPSRTPCDGLPSAAVVPRSFPKAGDVGSQTGLVARQLFIAVILLSQRHSFRAILNIDAACMPRSYKPLS